MKSMLIAAEAAESRAARNTIGHPDVAVPAAQRELAEYAARVVIVLLFSLMVYRLGMNFLETGRMTGLLLLASEGLVVVFTVVRRIPAVVDRSLRARLLTTIAMIGPPLVAPSSNTPMLADSLTVAVSAAGLLVVIAGKLSLGRSFGLIPANRGIVSTGLYRIVRHPIYLGYLITHVAFLAAHPSIWNISLLITADTALLARAVCEEQTLATDEQYRAYQTRVRWRVVPGLF